MRWILRRECELYNAALQNRRDAWKKAKKSISAYDQMKEIEAIRQVRPEYREIHSHLLQDAITRVDRAYDAFFLRVANGEKPGYPRFKSSSRYRTFTFKQAATENGVKLVGGDKRLWMSGIGKVRLRMHRPIEGDLKQVSVTLCGDGRWYAAFICNNVPAKPMPATGEDIGIDLGITTYAMLSNGKPIDNPRPMEVAQEHLANAQRKVARCRKWSSRRRKAVSLLAKQHAKVRACRKDFQRKLAHWLCQRYDNIGVEDLNVKGLAQGFLARCVHDAAWGQFISILEAKAESAGRRVVRVNPRGTTQLCSRCGALVPKDLSVRIHDCPVCGYVVDRDLNSAQEVFNRMGRILREEEASGLSDPRSPRLATS